MWRPRMENRREERRGCEVQVNEALTEERCSARRVGTARKILNVSFDTGDESSCSSVAYFDYHVCFA